MLAAIALGSVGLVGHTFMVVTGDREAWVPLFDPCGARKSGQSRAFKTGQSLCAV